MAPFEYAIFNALQACQADSQVDRDRQWLHLATSLRLGYLNFVRSTGKLTFNPSLYEDEYLSISQMPEDVFELFLEYLRAELKPLSVSHYKSKGYNHLTLTATDYTINPNKKKDKAVRTESIGVPMKYSPMEGWEEAYKATQALYRYDQAQKYRKKGIWDTVVGDMSTVICDYLRDYGTVSGKFHFTQENHPTLFKTLPSMRDRELFARTVCKSLSCEALGSLGYHTVWMCKKDVDIGIHIYVGNNIDLVYPGQSVVRYKKTHFYTADLVSIADACDVENQDPLTHDGIESLPNI